MASRIEVRARALAEIWDRDGEPSVAVAEALNDLAAAVRAAEPSTTDDLYRQAADECWGSDEIDIDDDAVVSAGSDHGAYVAAWVWVDDSDVSWPEGVGPNTDNTNTDRS